MANKLQGDWIYLTNEQANKLFDFVSNSNLPIIGTSIKEPALSEVNVDMYEQGMNRSIIFHFKTFEGNEIRQEVHDDFFNDIDVDYGFITRVYGREGNQATPAYEIIRYVEKTDDGQSMICTKAYRYPSFGEWTKDFMLHSQLFTLFLYAGVQTVIHSYGDQLVTRKEYKKGIKSKVVHGEMYNAPGKVLVYQLPSVTDEMKSRIRKHIEVIVRHCEAWGVRGHYRHYKNGTVVYIKPYVKGINKSAYKGREYVLFKEEA